MAQRTPQKKRNPETSFDSVSRQKENQQKEGAAEEITDGIERIRSGQEKPNKQEGGAKLVTKEAAAGGLRLRVEEEDMGNRESILKKSSLYMIYPSCLSYIDVF